MTKAALKIVSKKLAPIAGDTPITVGGIRVFQVVVPISSFFSDFRDNSNQRDTELRATKHLEIFAPEHLEVACLMTMQGELVLLNGHTRRLYWLKHTAVAPAFVRMTVYEIVDSALDAEKEELRLYSSFDSRSAVKTSAHTIQGTMRSINLTLNTPWLRAGNFASALRSAAGFCGISSSSTVAQLMEEFRVELTAFDGILPKKREFVSPFIAASLVMMRKAPAQQVTEILSSYQDGDINKIIQNGTQHSIYKLMRDYRRDGLNGSGRFPTNTADFDSAVCRFSKLIFLALTMGEKTMVEMGSFRSYTRTHLQNLNVDVSKVVSPI